MPETLVIRLPEDLSTDASWTVIDDAGTRIGEVGSGPLTDAANAQDQRQVLVLVPGTQTVATHAQLPVKSASKMLQVVPFALEEQLAGDVTRMHFAVGVRRENGDVPVLAVRRDRMQGWVDALNEAGVHAGRVMPETAGLPVTEGGYTVLMSEHEACIRDPDGIACFIDLESLIDTLELMITPADDADADAAQPPIHVFFDDATSVETLLEHIKARLPHTEFRRLPMGTLPRLAAQAIDSPVPSLLQGEFSVRGKMDKFWRPWRTAASLAVVLLSATIAVKATEFIVHKKNYDNLRGQMSALYQSKVPGASADERDPYGSLRRLVGGDGPSAAESDFLDGLSVFATSITNDKTYLEGISFSNGQMNLVIMAPNVPTLDALRIAISDQAGWQATLTQTRDKDSSVEGRLQLLRSAP